MSILTNVSLTTIAYIRNIGTISTYIVPSVTTVFDRCRLNCINEYQYNLPVIVYYQYIFIGKVALIPNIVLYCFQYIAERVNIHRVILCNNYKMCLGIIAEGQTGPKIFAVIFYFFLLLNTCTYSFFFFIGLTVSVRNHKSRLSSESFIFNIHLTLIHQ